MYTTRQFMIALVFVCLVFGNPSLVDACPNCKDALELERAIAFGSSVLLLMSMPFALGMVWYRAIVNATKRQAVDSVTVSTSSPDNH